MSTRNHNYYKVGAFSFEISSQVEFAASDCLNAFAVEPDNADCYHYEIDLVDELPESDAPVVSRRENISVHTENGLETRYIGVKGLDHAYACYREMSDNRAVIAYRRAYLSELQTPPAFISLFALEKHVLATDSIVLHCAYMEHGGRAVLFSAPSETGKTTQASLWKQYRGCDTVNGDRALLRRVRGKWFACGWPVCGTSGICMNKEMPIEAIVMLSQAQENRTEQLRPMKAFSQVYSQITINRWNSAAHEKAMGLIEQLITDVPVFHLACNISEDAVVCLEQALETLTISK